MVHNPLSMAQISGGRFPYLFEDESQAASVLRICQENHWVGQIVGPHGSGKTTLTHWLVDQCEQKFSSVVHVTVRGSRPRQIQRCETKIQHVDHSFGQQRTLFVVDGIERLRWWHRRILIRAMLNAIPAGEGSTSNGMLVTTHRQLSGLKLLYQTQFDAATLQQIVSHIAETRSDQSAAVVFASDQWQAAVQQAAATHGTDGRAMLMQLYDQMETMLRNRN